MTTTVPSVEARATQAPTTRQYIRYLFYKARPEWRQLGPEQRSAARAELLATLEPFAERLAVLRAYRSVGLGEQEFVVAFRTDYPSDFLDLVERLRGGEASAYSERETPIFTCVGGSVPEVIELLG